jgi:uncharacterized phage protein (TIGR01671 family)
MRGIRFRAWHESKKVMYMPTELGQDDMTISANGKGFLNVSGVHPRFTQEMPWLIPMQYTGVKFKNTALYEGDIIRWMGDNGDCFKGVITFKETDSEQTLFLSGFCVESCVDISDDVIGDDGELIEGWDGASEVIGNIYENPELLK